MTSNVIDKIAFSFIAVVDSTLLGISHETQVNKMVPASHSGWAKHNTKWPRG